MDDYSLFLPWCSISRITRQLSRDDLNSKHIDMEAELEIGYGAFCERYSSHVQGYRDQKTGICRIEATSITGSHIFDHMHTKWTMKPLESTDASCLVQFHTEFKFKSPLHAQTSQLVFDRVSKSVLRAFQDRARSIYTNKHCYTDSVFSINCCKVGRA